MRKVLQFAKKLNSSKKLMALAFTLFLAGGLIAQQSEMIQLKQNSNLYGAEKAPGFTPTYNQPSAQAPALWDIQFSFNVSDTAGYLGQAGAFWTGTEFWVSRWASDTMISYDANGSLISIFQIPGVAGTRGMTGDGTNVYIGDNTTTIKVVNPATKTVSGTISAPQAVRFIAYDSTANTNAGGFYIGNFNTDIDLISMTGSVLSTIGAVTHGLGGMYGAAWNNDAGGAKLWIFNQGGTNGADIQQLNLPTGTPSLIKHDVVTDVGVGVGNTLAGGLFITDGLVSGKRTIGGLLQGDPNLLFGYELAGANLPGIDAQMSAGQMTQGYTQIPINHATGLTFFGDIFQFGTGTITTANLDVTVKMGATTVFTDQKSTSGLASGANMTLTSGAFAPASIGTYDVTIAASVALPQVDSFPANDEVTFSFEVTDTTYARDDGIHDGGNGYAVSQTDWGYAVSLFDIMTTDTLTSVWISIANPIQGDTTYAVVFNTGGGFPGSMVGQSWVTIIQSSTTDYTISFPGGVELTPGQYVIGVYEGANTTINLAQSNSVYTDGMNFFFSQSSWFQSSITTARFLRPNFGIASLVGIDNDNPLAQSLKVYPNPSQGQFNMAFNLDKASDVEISVMNSMGKKVSEFNYSAVKQNVIELSLDSQPAGIYFVEVKANGFSTTRKLMNLK